MPLECSLLLLDTSEYMRNGDYLPTRLASQHDAVQLLVNQKTRDNPESTVGILTMGSSSETGGGGQLVASPTDDSQKIMR